MMDELFNFFHIHKKKIIPLLVGIIVLDGWLWIYIARPFQNGDELAMHFLDVGQGDAELVVFPTGVTMLIDGGPAKGNVSAAIASVLSPVQRTIDVVVLTHAQSDHMEGLIEVLSRYRVRAIAWSGVEGSGPAFSEFMSTVRKQNIPMYSLKRGDVIRNADNVVRVLSPNSTTLKSKDLNDSSLIFSVFSASTTALFTADASARILSDVAKYYPLRADIVKVPHHGSRTSVSQSFLSVIRPIIAIIEVGKNSYGHPTQEALSSLAEYATRILRTDERGTISIRVGTDRKVHVTTSKSF
jgi:beta-lactamase superfamily II metal-dependent hydrolase